jgi:hypothetical protein
MTAPIAPTETPIEVVQGQTFNMRVTWTDNQATPQPISLSGRRSVMQIRTKRSYTGTLMADLASDGTDPALTNEPSGATGQVQIRIPATVTALLTKTTYYYDLFTISESDVTDAVRLVFGAVTVSPSVSNPT